MAKDLSEQVRSHAFGKPEMKRRNVIESVITTGSTLLDLAISGGVVRGGGIPGGKLVEIFGPPSCGKTVMLCEIAGAIQRQGGEVIFHDPEARINKQFARMFGFDTSNITIEHPDTVPQVFKPIRKWNPLPKGKIHGVFADSLAALTTEMEMDTGDKMGGRRAKEFSQELRLTTRVIPSKNVLMVCSNQLRENMNAGPYEPKFRTPGGQGIPYYASLRLQCSNPQKLKKEKNIGKKTVTRIIGVVTDVKVVKSSIWQPFREAKVIIRFDYGIDDISANLQYVKGINHSKMYAVRGVKLSNSLDETIRIVEGDGLERRLRNEVINLWSEIEEAFHQERKPKRWL